MGVQIRSEIKELSPVERELSVVVPGTEVAKELDKAYRQLAQKVKLKGFRQGKVPRYVLEQFYKVDTEAQVLETIVGESFREAVKSHDIEPVANPTIDSANELIAGMDFSYSARVEIKPVIELKEWKQLSIMKTIYEVGDADIDAEVQALRESLAKVVAVEDRDIIQQGDLVEVNWSGTVDGEHVKGLTGVSFVIVVVGGAFYTEAEQALVGKKLNEMFTVDVVLPEAFAVEAVRGKTAQLSIRPLGIKAKTLPAIDDELAKDVSDELESLAQLKDKIRDSLETQAKTRTTNELRDSALTMLIEKNPLEIPGALVERQAEQIAADRLSRLPRRQAELIWQSQGARLREDARPLAMKQVRAGLLLEELVKREGIEITDADLEAHFEKVAGEMGSTVKAVKGVFKKGQRLDELRFQLATSRMLDRVLEQATVAETTQSIRAKS